MPGKLRPRKPLALGVRGFSLSSQISSKTVQKGITAGQPHIMASLQRVCNTRAPVPTLIASRQVRPKVSERLMVTKQSADRYSCGSSCHHLMDTVRTSDIPAVPRCPGEGRFPERPYSGQRPEHFRDRLKESVAEAATPTLRFAQRASGAWWPPGPGSPACSTVSGDGPALTECSKVSWSLEGPSPAMARTPLTPWPPS